MRHRVISCSGAAIALSVAAFLPVVATAYDGHWALCGAGSLIPDRPPAESASSVLGSTRIAADTADLTEEGTSVLSGRVQIIRGDQQIEADTVSLTQPQDVLDASGNIRYWEDGIFLSGDTAHMNLESDVSELENAAYVYTDGHARGTAEHVTLTGRDLLVVRDGTYTTCDPDDEEWRLRADHVELDRVSEWGKARNVVVEFKGVPIFYSPYLSFPLTDERKSGFLAPGYGVTNETGVELLIPYYWNIAPNQDATFAARGMSERGVQLQGEYRYLTRRGEGQLGVEYLPHDAKSGGERAAFSFQHDGTFAPRWYTDINVDWVSDQDYFEELGTSLEMSSQSFLERHFDLSYSGAFWAFSRVQDYQTLDDTVPASSLPYERLPQLMLVAATPARNRGVNLAVRSELVNFERSSSVTGTRVDIRPIVSYPIRSAYSFLVPSVAVRYTGYSLEDNPSEAGGDDLSRVIPTLALDSGLFFDKTLTLAAKSYTQTLEPRLYYLYTPFDDQNDIPIFDTGEFTFSFAQLFREDRFSGADRVGDFNALTLALTTRLLSPGGGELARLSIGQAQFFSDRRVQLPGTPTQTSGSSDLVLDVAAKLYGDWRVSGGFLLDTNEGRTDRTVVRLRYQPDYERILNFEYRFIRDVIEQVDGSFRWPFWRNWGAVGRWTYALSDERTLEAVGGLEYNSCCWAGRAVVRRYLRDSQGQFENAVFFQLELKGLAGVGKKTEEFLERTVPGFHNTF